MKIFHGSQLSIRTPGVEQRQSVSIYHKQNAQVYFLNDWNLESYALLAVLHEILLPNLTAKLKTFSLQTLSISDRRVYNAVIPLNEKKEAIS